MEVDDGFLVRGPSAEASLVSIMFVLDKTHGVLDHELREHLIGVRMHLEFVVASGQDKESSDG